MKEFVKEEKIFQSEIRERMKLILAAGLLLGSFVSLGSSSVYGLIASAPSDFFYIWFTNPLSWPVGILTCGILAYAGTCIFKTKVIVGKKQVEIHQFFKTKTVDVTTTEFTYEDDAKQHIVFLFKFFARKKYLEIKTEAGEESRYRIYFFGEKKFNGLVTELTSVSISDIPVEERVEIRQEVLGDDIEQTLYLGKDRLFSNERNRLLKTLGIYAVLFILILVIFVGSSDGELTTFKLLIIMFALPLSALELMAETAVYMKNKSRCPDSISYREGLLRIGEHKFSSSEIKRISMTSPLLRSGSIIPVQNYIEVHTQNGSHKFWLGSEGIQKLCGYQDICNFVKAAFLFAPEKIHWNIKQSLFTK